MTRLAVATLMLLCAGCAPALTTAQQDSLDEIQALADAVARAYQFPPVHVRVGPTPRFGHELNLIQVTPAILDAPLPIRDVAAASLLAFMIIRPPPPLSEAHERELYRKTYPESKLKAVDILVRVKGLPPETAARVVHAFLAGRARAQQATRDRPSYQLQTPHPCEELKAFVKAFPQLRLESAEWCP